MGLAISVASTVVLLRGLMDNSLLNSVHGQTAVGWLVLEDIFSVLILVLMPAMASTNGAFNWLQLGETLIKAAAFFMIMFFGGVRIIPWLLERTAQTRSRELFILAILAITLGIAMAASELFGVSLALGAFVAGAIISQSHLSHQVGADVFAFREAFSVLFFVSVGMLVNPIFVWMNLSQVISLTLLVVVGKSLLVMLMGLFVPRSARTFLIIAVGMSQIGEFSFILGEGGVRLNLLNADQYSLVLAASLISITLNPFMFKLLPFLEKLQGKLAGTWKKFESKPDLPEILAHQLVDHVVVIGYGRVGEHLVDVLQSLQVPLLVIEDDVERIETLNARHIVTLFGDASNSEVITHARLESARAVVVTVPEETAVFMITASVKSINSRIPTIVRAASRDGVLRLGKLGADHIVHPELEGGLEIIYHTLLQLGYPLREVHEYAEAVRRDGYDLEISSNDEHRSLRDLLIAAASIEITWLQLGETSPLIGKTLLDADIRSNTGTSVIALIRENKLIANPKSSTEFSPGDRIGLMGEKEQIENARNWLTV
jgi:CPA2 family monovalent cation:H+ antiporter-2